MTPKEILTKGFKSEMKLAISLALIMILGIGFMSYDTGKWNLFWYGVGFTALLTLKFWYDRKERLKQEIKEFEK